MLSKNEPGDKRTPGSDTPVAVAETPETAGSEQRLETTSPLTLAVLRTRFLDAFATPCHGRGVTFILAGGEYAQ